MTFEQKKARAIALMDSKKMWRSNYAPPLLRILWRLGIRLPPLPFMPFWQVAVLTGGLWGTSWGCAMWFIYWGPSGMVAGEAIIINRFPRPSHWTREYTHECVEKIKALFPHLRAEGGGFIPLKIGISNDISAFLAEHPETELTMDEWLCAVSCITSRRVYLQRTAVAGVPRYGLDGHPKGQVSDSEAQSAGRRLATLEQKWLRTQAQQENISGQ